MSDTDLQETPRREFAGWVRRGAHLPTFLRDDHAQKDVFRAVHEWSRMDERPQWCRVDPVAANIYIIDDFLHWMAAHGYTLQRSRAAVVFCDIQETLDESRRRRREAFRRLLETRPETPERDEGEQAR